MVAVKKTKLNRREAIPEMGRTIFDYSKLRGQIAEKCGSQKRFANAMGVTPSAISLKLNNKLYFSQDDILRAISVLGIEPVSISSYFFTRKL